VQREIEREKKQNSVAGCKANLKRRKKIKKKRKRF
jgi:hypothetical protein